MGLLDIVRFVVTHPVGKRAPLRALGRVAAWQIASRASPGAIAVPFIGGARLLVERGMTGATGNVYVGLHEFEGMAFVLHALRPSDLFLDVGANVGSYTVLAAKGVGCRCVTVEPIAATVQKLRDNIALNHVTDRVDLYECAVGESEGVVRMTMQNDTVNHVVTSYDVGTAEVPCRTLDGLLGDRAPLLFKMDIEGHELAALRGGRGLLSNPALAGCIVETLGAGGSDNPELAEVAVLLGEHGFQPASYDPWQRKLMPIARLNLGGNTLFVRDWEALSARIRSAPAFEVLGQRC